MKQSVIMEYRYPVRAPQEEKWLAGMTVSGPIGGQ
jgi:hypothetical protein